MGKTSKKFTVVYLDDGDKLALQARALKAGQSVSDVIRGLVREYLGLQAKPRRDKGTATVSEPPGGTVECVCGPALKRLGHAPACPERR
jgi:plasmid stability protein